MAPDHAKPAETVPRPAQRGTRKCSWCGAVYSSDPRQLRWVHPVTKNTVRRPDYDLMPEQRRSLYVMAFVHEIACAKKQGRVVMGW